MSIPITCPQCEKTLDVPDSAAGRRVKCRCGTVVAVPAVDDELSLDEERRPRTRSKPLRKLNAVPWMPLAVTGWMLFFCVSGVLLLVLVSRDKRNTEQGNQTSQGDSSKADSGLPARAINDQKLWTTPAKLIADHKADEALSRERWVNRLLVVDLNDVLMARDGAAMACVLGGSNGGTVQPTFVARLNDERGWRDGLQLSGPVYIEGAYLGPRPVSEFAWMRPWQKLPLQSGEDADRMVLLINARLVAPPK